MAERARAKRTGKKKGAQPPKNGPAPGHNSGVVPDEVYSRWLDKIGVADNAYQRAHETARKRKAELGAVFKAAEADGCNIAAIKRARQIDKLDHNQVAIDYSDTGRVLEIMGSKLVQADLFKSVKRPDPESPYLIGLRDGKAGVAATSNPFTPGTDAFQQYADGWVAGQGENQQTLRDRSSAPLLQ